MELHKICVIRIFVPTRVYIKETLFYSGLFFPPFSRVDLLVDASSSDSYVVCDNFFAGKVLKFVQAQF